MNGRSFREKPAKKKTGKTTVTATTEAKSEKRPRARKGDDVEHRTKILRAAEALFSKQGFHGTGLREIADKAGVSLGNIYNHFDTKEAIFSTLLSELEKEYLNPNEPLPKALLSVDFPDGLEEIGLASRETVKKFASYIRLIYVDVIEFDGHHVARVYGTMKERYQAVFAERFEKAKKDGRLNDGVDPLIGTMMASILFMYYFTVEHLFGVKRHYGLDDEQVVKEFVKVLRQGLLKR
jgi:AcrR family transcriptional regulator